MASLVVTASSSVSGVCLENHRARLPRQQFLALFVDQIPWDQEIDFSDFMGLIRVKPSGRIAATVVQTRPGQFATMPVAAL